MNIKLTDSNRLEIKELFDKEVSVKDIAAKFNVSNTTVRDTIIKMGGVFKPQTDTKRRYKLNEACFDNFTTEDSLYFYGLLLGDGNISKDRPRIKISLMKSDREILEKFRLFLGTDRPIKENKLNFSVVVDSVKISKVLSEQNFEPAKSTKEKLPAFYSRENYEMRHFWRGLVDADGSLYFGKYSENICLLSSEEIASEFKEFVKYHLGIEGSRLEQHQTSTKCFYSKFHCRNAIKVAEMLYKDSNIFLDRKFCKYLEFMKREIRFIEKDANRYIYFSKDIGKWKVYIDIPRNPFRDKKKVYLGAFKDKDVAVSIRDEFVSLYKSLL